MQEKYKSECECDGSNKNCECVSKSCKTCVSCNTIIKGNFRKYMINHKKKEGEDPTHTSIGGNGCYGGSWHISKDDYPEFCRNYKKMAQKKLLMDNDIKLALVERSPRIAPYYLDVDIHSNSPDRVYDDDFIIETIKRTNYIIRKNFSIENQSILTAYVFEKDAPTEDKNDYKDGFHIMYPELILDVESRYYIYDKFMEVLKVNNYIEDFNIKHNNSLDEIFDRCVIYDNGVLMYGSAKGGRTPYQLTQVYNPTYKKILPDHYDETDYNGEIMDINDILDNTFMRIHQDEEDDVVKPLTETIEENIINNYKNNHDTSEGKKRKKKNNNIGGNESEGELETVIEEEDSDEKILRERNRKRVDPQQLKKEVAIAKELCKVFKAERATNYDLWSKVGWALHNISPTDLLDTWLTFSKKAGSKYDKDGCLKLWKEARDEGYSLGSLRMWARQDDEKKYIEALNAYSQNILEKVCTGTHVQIAEYLHILYGHMFVCTDIKKKEWYEFHNHRWISSDEGKGLWILMTGPFLGILRDALNDNRFINRMEKNHCVMDEEINKKMNIRNDHYSKMSKVLDNLNNVSFINNIMTACCRIFHDASFKEKLDSNPHYLGFENGIYDLTNLRFRIGAPEDYISKSTGYDYLDKKKLTKYDYDYQKRIKKFFESCIPKDQVRTYVLRFIASCLDGVSKEQQFPFWVGKGGNGKSVTISMIQNAFGNYWSSMSSAYLTKKRNDSSAASPDLADKVGVRIITFQETEDNETIQVSKLKELCGNDTMPARGLFEKQMYFKPQAKYVLSTNKLPDLKVDGGVKRRIRCVRWEMQFKDPKDLDPTNQRHSLKDPTLEEAIKKLEWKQNFMYLLINEYFPQYLKEGLCEPDEVTSDTTRYMEDNDEFARFLNSCTERIDSKKRTKLDLLFDSYQEFFEKYYGKKGLNRARFIRLLNDNDFKVETKNKNDYIFGLQPNMNIEEDDNTEIND